MRVLPVSKIGFPYIQFPKEQENERSSSEVLNSWLNENESQIWQIFCSTTATIALWKESTCERGRKTERKRTILILSVICLVWLEKSSRLDCRHLGSMWPVKQRLLMALHQRKDSISSLAHTFELLFFPLKTKVSSPASDMSPALSITICYGISPLKNHPSPPPLSLLPSIKQNPTDASYLVNYICNQQE